MKRKKIIMICITVLFIALIAWRLWPRSIDSFMDSPVRDIDRLNGYLTMSEVENGQPVLNTYKVEANTPQDSQRLFEILGKGKYQASLTNLLPWTWGRLSSGFGYDGRSIHIHMFFDGDEPSFTSIIMYGGDKSSVDGRRVLPIGNDVFNELAEYIQANGTLEPNS